MNPKIARFLAEQCPPTPCVVVDLDVIANNYQALRKHLPFVDVYYAVKANPAPEILGLLAGLGSNFDVASVFEIKECLTAGITPERMSYGNTIKKQADIAYAYALGVRLFAFDSAAELKKLAAAAPGSRVFCRLLIDNTGAEWPLSRKFGCALEMAHDLMLAARDLGLDPYGLSFHVGSQQTDLSQWDIAVGKAKMLVSALNEAGIEVRMLNVGGGFPAQYRSDIRGVEEYAEAVHEAIARHFGNNVPSLIVEPGRSLAGDSGVMQAEVVLISQKSYDDDVRWVYLDVGKFSGLAETMDEAIKYRIRTPHDGGAVGPVVLAGPTCDSVDILYEKAGYELPLDLKVGDKVEILSTGAYTTTYSSVGFNGFPPLAAYYI